VRQFGRNADDVLLQNDDEQLRINDEINADAGFLP